MIEPHKAIGYATVTDRLKRVQHVCGLKRVYTILAQHGVNTVRDLHPRNYPKVIYQCEFVVSSARIWEAMLCAKEQVINPPKAARFKDTVDAWFNACDRELQLMSPELFNDRGDPLN